MLVHIYIWVIFISSEAGKAKEPSLTFAIMKTIKYDLIKSALYRIVGIAADFVNPFLLQ